MNSGRCPNTARCCLSTNCKEINLRYIKIVVVLKQEAAWPMSGSFLFWYEYGRVSTMYRHSINLWRATKKCCKPLFITITLAQFRKKQYLCQRNWVIGFVWSFLFALFMPRQIGAKRMTNRVHIDKSVYCALSLISRKTSQLFLPLHFKSKWAIDAYRYGICHIASAFAGALCRHIRVGFWLFIWP